MASFAFEFDYDLQTPEATKVAASWNRGFELEISETQFDNFDLKVNSGLKPAQARPTKPLSMLNQLAVTLMVNYTLKSNCLFSKEVLKLVSPLAPP